MAACRSRIGTEAPRRAVSIQAPSASIQAGERREAKPGRGFAEKRSWRAVSRSPFIQAVIISGIGV